MKTLCLEPQYVTEPEPDAHFRSYAVNDIYERALVLLTPAAVGQVILPDQPLHLTSHLVEEESVKSWLQPGAELAPERGYMLDIQRAGIILLRQRGYGLNQRLIMLGLFLEDAVDYVATERGHQLGALIKSYNSPTFKVRFDEAMRAIAFDACAYTGYLGTLLQRLERQGLLQDKATLADYYDLIRQIFGIGETQEAQQTQRTYRECRKAIQEHVEQRCPYLLENYLIYTFFSHFYPCSLAGGMVHNYWTMVTIYKLCELSLLVLSAVRRDQLHLHDIYDLFAYWERRQLQPEFLPLVEHYVSKRENQSLELFNALYDLAQS